MAEPLTDAALKMIAERHQDWLGYCSVCMVDENWDTRQPWPCDAVRLVAEVQRLRAIMRTVL